MCVYIYRACIYMCDCAPLCVPIPEAETDECKLRNICGHGECENRLNGHTCHCHPGYHLNPQKNICEGKRRW